MLNSGKKSALKNAGDHVLEAYEQLSKIFYEYQKIWYSKKIFGQNLFFAPDDVLGADEQLSKNFLWIPKNLVFIKSFGIQKNFFSFVPKHAEKWFLRLFHFLWIPKLLSNCLIVLWISSINTVTKVNIIL